jgi:hypothetical protein
MLAWVEKRDKDEKPPWLPESNPSKRSSRIQPPAARESGVRRSPDYEKGRERGGVLPSQPPHLCNHSWVFDGDDPYIICVRIDATADSWWHLL